MYIVYYYPVLGLTYFIARIKHDIAQKVKSLRRKIKGVGKKTSTFENHSDETVSPAKIMLEGWFI